MMLVTCGQDSLTLELWHSYRDSRIMHRTRICLSEWICIQANTLGRLTIPESLEKFAAIVSDTFSCSLAPEQLYSNKRLKYI
ncbi:uncharacterized protein PHALS_14802 [Plasmopara halstedii]|uniref:Uncharacterized protein n=1 Tax=Plasmopara halstedii TaxID=4781 RepID=A0A0P1AWB8_PLAHL|nr:uncharacterized protein PHALS_14802 [Plasmopara halstedii]CEG45310.1 hypothetical protein PHALS_14802 [Plasmopara halstedii]|eukprot:XP_024581679.1 hypothetical protein PHALS_14802 [Plasmopara halstedii]